MHNTYYYYFTNKRDYFITQLNDTLKAISPRTTLPILTGIKIDAKEHELILTGSDSEISIEITIPKTVDGEDIVNISETGKDVKLSTNEQFQTLITSGLSEFNLSGLDPDQYPLLPQVSRDDAIQLSVNIFFASNQVLFKVGNVNFISRLLEGHYPDTTRLFPENYEIKLSIDNGEFYHAIDRASLLAREGGNNVIKLSTGDDVVELSSTSPEIGTVKEEVDANDVEGGNLKISFNSKYMMDALKAIDNDEVEVEFFGTMKPFILKPKGDDSVTQLILPIRTY
nr:DNA polymerase III subunit beta [Staphylococcus aureus]